MTVLSVALLLPFAKAGSAMEDENAQHFKMLSTIEYTGEGQFRNQVEALFTVLRQPLSDDKVRYFLFTDDFDLLTDDPNSGQLSFSKGLSFVIDRKTGHLSGYGEDLALLGKVNNQCVRSLSKTTKKNVGKTWKQSFDLSSFGKSLPRRLTFTLTAIQLDTKVLGEAFNDMIAVRALSEPFIVKAAKEEGTGVGGL